MQIAPTSLAPTPDALRELLRGAMAAVGAKVSVWAHLVPSPRTAPTSVLFAMHQEGPEMLVVAHGEDWNRVPASSPQISALLKFYLDSAGASPPNSGAPSPPESGTAADALQTMAALQRDLLRAGREAQALVSGAATWMRASMRAQAAAEKAAKESLEQQRRVHERALARSLKDLKQTELALEAAIARAHDLENQLRAARAGMLVPGGAEAQGARGAAEASLACRLDALFLPAADATN